MRMKLLGTSCLQLLTTINSLFKSNYSVKLISGKTMAAVTQQEFWNSRYTEEGYAYGTKPNNQLVESIQLLKSSGFNPPKSILTIAEGEGRNAIYLASEGYNVHAMDFSEIGMNKLAKDAISLNLGDKLSTECGDLSNYDFGSEKWDMIVNVFVPLPRDLKESVIKRTIQSLKPGGYYVEVSYHPTNIGRGTGGPQNASLCETNEFLDGIFEGLKIIKSIQLEAVCDEGKYHSGQASLVHFIAQKHT